MAKMNEAQVDQVVEDAGATLRAALSWIKGAAKGIAKAGHQMAEVDLGDDTVALHEAFKAAHQAAAALEKAMLVMGVWTE